MASPDAGAGPKPYKQRRASTIFLRVPAYDWAAVRLGAKREFRAASGAVSGLKFVDPPTPVVAYTWAQNIGWESQLMVLEDRWQEPLAAISAESLAAEGFQSFDQFRAYWCARERRRFTPTRMVVAYRVRPFVWDEGPDGDQTRFAEQIFDHLYGAFYPEEIRPPQAE
jgi:hypothetical protein